MGKNEILIILVRNGVEYLFCRFIDSKKVMVLVSRRFSNHHFTLFKEEMFPHTTYEGEDVKKKHSFIVNSIIQDGKKITHAYPGTIALENLTLDTDKGIGFPSLHVDKDTFVDLKRVKPSEKGKKIKINFDENCQYNIYIGTEQPTRYELLEKSIATLQNGREVNLYLAQNNPNG